MKIPGVIVILGSVNDEKGNLIATAKERTKKAVEVFYSNPGYKIIPTGGYGSRFNTTNKPHALYIKKYLLELGLFEEDILPFAESTNTIEDLRIAKEILDRFDIKNVIAVTSDFHAIRAKVIMKKVFGLQYKLRVVGTSNTLPFKIKVRKYYHEARQTIRLGLGLIRIK